MKLHGERCKQLLSFSIFLLPAVLAFSQHALAAEPAGSKPNVVLITMDTIRADRMGFLGSDLRLTPNLDALARQSVVFTRAYSQVPLTTPSHATILTGVYPQFHRVNDFHTPLATELPYLPEILHSHGYSTAAFVSSFVLDPSLGAPGFDRGFDTYNAPQSGRRSAADVLENASAWLKQQRTGSFFLWLHLYDAHVPYESQEPFKSRYSDAYNAAIAYEDSVLDQFLVLLRELGAFDNTIVVIASDHGEAFGEHGERQHGFFLYDETIHVPLLVKMPGQRFAGARITDRVGLIDISPDVLDILGIPIPATMQGQPSVALATKKDTNSAKNRAIYSRTDYPYLAFGWSPVESLRSQGYLFIEAPRRELYDESSDTHAEKNLATTSPAVTETLAAQLGTLRKQTTASALSAHTQNSAVNDSQRAQQLASLGYVASNRNQAGSQTVVGNPGRGLPDTKDKIEVANQMSDALLAIDQKRYNDAIPLLRYVTSQEPNNLQSNRALGECYTRTGDYASAIPLLRKALQLGSDNAMTHYLLGISLFGASNWQEAASEFENVVHESSGWGDPHYLLAESYNHLNRPADARRELEATLTLQPDHFQANLELGDILLTEQKPAEALIVLQKAEQASPQSIDAHRLLAVAYTRLKRDADASREQAEADRLEQSSRH